MILRPSMRSYVDGLHLPPSFMPELVAILKMAAALEGRVCICHDAWKDARKTSVFLVGFLLWPGCDIIISDSCLLGFEGGQDS